MDFLSSLWDGVRDAGEWLWDTGAGAVNYTSDLLGQIGTTVGNTPFLGNVVREKVAGEFGVQYNPYGNLAQLHSRQPGQGPSGPPPGFYPGQPNYGIPHPDDGATGKQAGDGKPPVFGSIDGGSASAARPSWLPNFGGAGGGNMTTMVVVAAGIGAAYLLWRG